MSQSAIFEQSLLVSDQYLDSFGHVNNVCYIAWMQDIAMAHSEALGLGFAQYQQLKHAMFAVEHHVQYRKPLFNQHNILLRTWLADLNALYSIRRYAFFDVQTQDIHFIGETKWACVDLNTGRAKRMSPTFTQAYQPLAKEINPYAFDLKLGV